MVVKKNNLSILFLIALLFVPLIIRGQYPLRVINFICLYAIVALSINLIVGFAGVLDMGRAAFIGIGGYWSALMMLRFNMPFIVAFISAGIICALIGFLLGVLCRGTTFDYLTLITIGFNFICVQVFLNWIPVTNGTMGLSLIPSPVLFGYKFDTNVKFYYFALFLLVICYVIIQRITNSKIGRAFEAMRDDPIAASFSGINVANLKSLNFAIASFFTGIAGASIAHYTNYMSPYICKFDESIYLLQMAIIGGLGSLPGTVLGTILLVVTPEISRTFYEYRLMFVGFIMVIMMLWVPNGLLGRNGLGDKIISLRTNFFNNKKNMYK